jgi:hypothetical protein
VSVFTILRVKGDPNTLEQYANDNADMMQRIGAEGRASGAIRHAFAGGDGEILVIDEWTDADSFHKFFENQTEIPRLMREGGAEGPPQISVYRKLDTPDAF